MKNLFRPRSKYGMSIFTLVVALITIQWVPAGFIGRSGVEAKITRETMPFDWSHPLIQAVMAVQYLHHSRLMAIPEVVGTATGLSEAGLPAIRVFLKNKVGPGVIPESLEGVPVVRKVTGEFFAMACGSGSSPTSNFALPVPIGVSTGNIGECSAGTIGARVRDAEGNIYALSNNHVFALGNKARMGSWILQPGLYDSGCAPNGNNVIGQLSEYVKIKMSKRAENNVDAAIALTTTSELCNSTPSGGYDVPSSTTVSASLNQPVQKYGRTTSLTKGTVDGINVTIRVWYGRRKSATFVNQITVTSPAAFIQAGDSGSLLVTDNVNANPVGLLFAGNETGTLGIANPIDAVLKAFNVTIDGR